MLARRLVVVPLLLASFAHGQDLVKIRRAVEAARRRSPVPGISLAVVKDGKVILAEGFGFADVARKRKATADTVYEIGSATKSFTALLAAQAQVEGRLSLSDRPTKYLPDFRLKDPDANAKITLEDMLSHRSGLPRTDLAWYVADFSRDDLLRVAAEAEPTAPLGKAWQYQNLMFLFMGMILEKAYGQSYESLLRTRFFGPLGMASSDSTYAATKAQPLLATGYATSGRALPLKSVDRIAPAGTISSTANDMARYVTMLLAKGEFEGKRAFSEAAIEETRKGRIAMPGGQYGLGWMLAEKDGEKRVFHGGNIDGFSALVTLVPEKGIGIVALSNGDAAPLPDEATEIVLDALLPPKPGPKATLLDVGPEAMGTYRLAAPPVELTFRREGKTLLFNQNGRDFPLELVGEKRYTFMKAIFLTFVEEGGKRLVRVEQGGRTFELTPAPPFAAPISAEALLAKTVEAQGGAAAIRRHDRYAIHYHARMPSEAIAISGVQYRRDAVSTADFALLYCLGRRIGEVTEATDAGGSSTTTSFGLPDRKGGPKAGDAILAADLRADLEPARAYRSLAILREDKVGETPVWVLEKTPFAGAKITEYVSKADARVLRRTSGGSSTEFSDFRTVDGLILPFRSVVTTPTGSKTILEFDAVRFDGYVPGWPWRMRE